MKTKGNRALKVGLLVFSAIAIFVFVVYFIGSKDNLFKSKTKITTAFNDIRGVVVGNNVRFSGITVGKVSGIEITSDSTVVLELDIVNEYAKYIYKDALVEINQDGLMGSKLLNITSGTLASGAIDEGSHLKGKEGIDMESMLYEAREMLVQTNDAIMSFKSIAGKIDSGNGDLARLINENTLTTELATTTRNLNNTLASVDQITRKINNGDGDLAKLLNDDGLTAQTYSVLSNLNQTAEKTNVVVNNLDKTTQSINSGDGPVNMLLNSKRTAENIDTTIVKVQNSLSEFDKTAKAIQDSWLIRLFSKKKKKDKTE